MSVYTPRMAKAIRQIKKPYDVKVDIVQGEGFVSIVVHEEDMLTLTPIQREEMMVYLRTVEKTIVDNTNPEQRPANVWLHGKGNYGILGT